jgi:hypothetical protein
MSTALKTTALRSAPHLQAVKLADPLIAEASEILETMGWSDIPTELKRSVAIDVIGYRDELLGLYATRDPHVMARRRSVYWWVEAYRCGTCSLETALDALKMDIC